MTKLALSKKQITKEFVEAEKVSVIRYDKDGKRISTYAGLNMHSAFREIIDACNHGIRVVVLRYTGNLDSDMIPTYIEAMASPNKVSFPRDFGSYNRKMEA